MKCKCPDTKYELEPAVCKGRQRVSYPKCKVCQFREGADQPVQEKKLDLKIDIFKSYDVRGIFPNEINEHVTEGIGSAFAKFLKEKNPETKNIVVGMDMRTSSTALVKALINGIISTGINVVNIGLVSTDVTYFAVGFYEFDASVMVTASHNPAKYNGFKFCREKAIPISFDTGLSEIAKIVQNSLPIPTGKSGRIFERDIFADYKAFVLRFLNKQLRPLRIVIDAGNGMAGKMVPIVFEKIPCEIVPLFFKLDGTFPNHDANPLEPKNLIELQKKVIEKRAHFGAAFDGDADRCVFVDERGKIVGGDIVTAIIAKEFLSKEKGASIIYDLRSSKVVVEEVKAAGGIPIRERVGHSHIKATMRKNDSVFAGELSGHYYYKNNYYADSAIITLIQMMNILSKRNIPLSNLVRPLKRYYSTGELNFEVGDKDSKIKELSEKFSDGNIDYLDGITVDYNDWWFNVRKSNTEPNLRLNLEAKSKEIMTEKVKIVTETIKK